MFCNCLLKTFLVKATIKNDLDESKIDMEFEEIRMLKKSEFKKMVKQKIVNRALEKLEEKKVSHSKVNHIQYGFLKTKTYLKSSKKQITNEERQEIFKLRSRATEVKINFKKKFENLLCEACKIEEETQQHILKCREIEKEEPKLKCNIDFEMIFHGSVEDKVQIARVFKKKMKIREKYLK